MSRFLIVFLSIFFAAALLTVLIEKDAGFVLLSYDNYFFRTSIWVFLVLYLLSHLVFYVLIRALIGLYRFNRKYRIDLADRHPKKSDLSAIEEGLMAFFEMDYPLAVSHFIKVKTQGPMRGIVGLFGSLSAEKIGDTDLQRVFLGFAKKGNERIKERADLLEAEIELKLGDPDLAIEALEKIKSPTKLSIEIKNRALLEAKRWKDVFKNLSLIEEVKDRAFFKNKAALLALNCNKKKDKLLTEIFNSFSKELKDDPEIILTYIEALKTKSDGEQILVSALDRFFDIRLINCYFEISAKDLEKLDNLTRWEKIHSDNSLIPLFKGRIYESLGEDTLAEEFLIKSKGLGNSVATQELLKFFVTRGNLKKARRQIASLP